MKTRRIWKTGLVIFVLGLIMTLGYGGFCKKKDHDPVITGSSLPQGTVIIVGEGS